MLFYIKHKKPHNRETWNGINLKLALNVKEVKNYLKLGIPGIFTSCECNIIFYQIYIFKGGFVMLVLY